MNLPEWQDVATVIHSAEHQLNLSGTEVHVGITGIEIFADPLLEKVFYNLMDNSLRHGDHVTRVDFTADTTEAGLVLTYSDNGAGIALEDKPKLFQKGFGKNNGLGLFLSREILSITGISITENGDPGKGVRFGIFVPGSRFRVR